MNMKTVELNNTEYYVVDEIKEKNLYYILINVNDKKDMQIRKVVELDGEISLVTLDSDEEFDRIINKYNSDERFLPIGTVCKLAKGEKKIMITGYLVSDEKKPDSYYDYSGCVFPEGVLNPKINLLFNHDQIEKVYFKGYINEESEEFLIKIKLADNHMKDLFKKEDTTN